MLFVLRQPAFVFTVSCMFYFLVIPDGRAGPEWLGATCYDYDFQGKRSMVSRQICRELFPTTFERRGCACMEISPTGTIIMPVEDNNCADLAPPNCGTKDGEESEPENRISRPAFLDQN